jgi:hypothetical protein
MKKLIIVLLFTFCFSSCYYQKSELEFPKNQIKLFEVLKIDSIENTYIIYVKKYDTIRRIVSSKIEGKNNCNHQIIHGNFYNFKIKSLFDDRFFHKRDIAGIRYNGTIIKLSDSLENVIWDLYISENIHGLCYENPTLYSKTDSLH